MTPELLVLGDSHAIAAKQGADALGLDAGFMYLSGNYWHRRLVQFHPQQGLWSRSNPTVRRQIAALRDQLGGAPLLSAERPVLMSAGFHLGRIAPVFAMHGHRVDADAMDAAPEALFASASFVEAHLEATRGYHRELLVKVGKRCPLVVLAPPPIGTDPVSRRFVEVIVARMRAAGLAVYDPRPDFDPQGQGLDPELIDADGVHGNARYGAELLGHLRERGLLVAPAGVVV